MKFASVASLLFLANWAAASYCPWTEADLNGTWWNSCSDCSFDQDSCVLSCNCDSISGQSYPSSIDLRNCSAKKVHNDDGSLTCESSFCIWPNRRYYEDLAGTQRSVEINEAFCAQRCRNTTDCLFYTFWNDGGCHIHGADATMSDQWKDGEPIAGNAYCEGYSCMQFSKMGDGGIVPGVSGKYTTTAMYCRNFCRDTEGCLAYTWYEDTWCRIHGDLEYDVVERPGAVYSKVSCATAVPTRSPTAAPTAEPTRAPTAEPTRAPTAEPTAEPTRAPTTEPTAAPTAEHAPGIENSVGLSCSKDNVDINIYHFWSDINARAHINAPENNVYQFSLQGGAEASLNIALVDSANIVEESLEGVEIFIGGAAEPVIHVSSCMGCEPEAFADISSTPVFVEHKFTHVWIKVDGSYIEVGRGKYGKADQESLLVHTFDSSPVMDRAIFTYGYGDLECIPLE